MSQVSEASADAMDNLLQNEDSNISVPQFLTSKYLEDILRKFNRDATLKVHSIKVGPCGGVGDAFASTMFRVQVLATSGVETVAKKGNYIVKMMPTLEIACRKLGSGSYDVHEKEMDIFQNVFPEFRKILKSVGEDKNVFPRPIAVDRVRGVLVLEDLKVKSFLMADRKIGLDLIHIKLALTKLARFHAASMVLLQKRPEIFERYDVGMFSRKTSAFNDFFSSNMDALIAEVSTWDDYELIASKLEKLKGRMYENAYKASDNEPGDMKVLAHGDLWLNNLMFTYNKKGLPIDVIMLDFQFCSVAHPAVDLLYFLYTSSIDEIRQTKIFELTHFYFVELRNVLIRLEYDPVNIPTLHQFQLQVMKKYFYAFPSSMIILPLMMSDDPESNFENVHQTNAKALAFKRRLYKNPKLQLIIQNSLPKFEQLGLLDEM